MSLFFFINWGRKAIKPPQINKIYPPRNITLLPGSAEITCQRKDIIALNLSSPINRKLSLQGAIDQINKQEGLAILAHPSYLLKPYGRRKLKKLEGYLGIEIYSPNKIPWPESTRRWDYILSKIPYTKIWGFSSDDMHDLKRDAGRAWIMVKSEDSTHRAILEALRRGSFFSTTGPIIEDILLNDNRIHLKMAGDYQAKFIGYNRKTLQISFGREAVYCIRPEDIYARVEIKDLRYKRKAWTQPIFIKEGKFTHFNYLPRGRWLRGCIHIHTKLKGGTASEDEVINWYKNHSYDFIAITEHNFIAHPRP